MIIYVKGNLFESPAKVLVNTVNTVGVMGKGIAKSFKVIYPDMFEKYQQLCERNLLKIGTFWIYKTPHKWILNFPTKTDWRKPSKPEYIELGLQKFVSSYSTLGITNIAFPQLGCGNGELDWKTVVEPLMKKYLGPLPIDVFVNLYDSDSILPEHRDIEATSLWLRSEPRTLSFEEVWSDLKNIIGSGINMSAWRSEEPFKISIASQRGDGLLIQKIPQGTLDRIKNFVARTVSRLRIINSRDIYIPKDALLDLWQNVRSHGFCVPRIMPEGLDLLAPYILALFSRLAYMKQVEISTSSEQNSDNTEHSLRLYPPPNGYTSNNSHQLTLAVQLG